MHGLYDTGIEYLIRLRQRNLTNYQYRFENPDMWPIYPPDDEELAHVTTLQLLVGGWEDYEHAIHLLESTPSLSSLDIQHDHNVSWPSIEFTRLCRGPRRLRFLRIENFCFTLGSSTIAGFVELEELEELQLIDCEEYSCLSRDIKSLPLKLKAFCIHEIDETTELFSSVENDLIRSLKPLVRMSLTLGIDFGLPSNLLDWSALQAHASTLQYLRVEYTWPELPFSKFHPGLHSFARLRSNWSFWQYLV